MISEFGHLFNFNIYQCSFHVFILEGILEILSHVYQYRAVGSSCYQFSFHVFVVEGTGEILPHVSTSFSMIVSISCCQWSLLSLFHFTSSFLGRYWRNPCLSVSIVLPAIHVISIHFIFHVFILKRDWRK